MRISSLRILSIVVTHFIGLSASSAFADGECRSELSRLQRIVLDPGHGGSNEGAVGVAGIYERHLTMDTAKRLQARLLACNPGLEVLLTRQTDIDVGLSERTHFANLHAADLFVSIHFNASENPAANGIEVFYLASEDAAGEPWDAQQALVAPTGVLIASILHDLERTRLHAVSAELARQLLTALVDRTHAVDRGVKQASFRVLRGALMPAAVVELGFLTHAEEGTHILDHEYREALVEALATGIAAFDLILADDS